jgi:hypothetical protein
MNLKKHLQPFNKGRSYLKSKTILFIIFIIFSFQLQAQVPLHTFRTKNLRLIYYDQAHSFLIPHLVRCFENAMKFHTSLFDYTPTEEVTILLQDFNDYGSAGTNTIPWNFINVGIEPFDYVYETSPTNERLNWIFNHELVHVLATDKASSTDNFFRTLFFGKVSPISENPMSMIYSYLTTPRWYSPRWYHEGIAVFMETWMSGGFGRAQNGYDEMVFRSMVHDSSHFYDIVGLESEGTTIDFQIGVNSYLYGTRFVSYLVYHYGVDKMLKWYNRTKGSKRYFSAQFRNVYGMSVNEAWSQWIQWEHQWQKGNLGRLHDYPVTAYRKIIHGSLGSVSKAYFDQDSRKLYVGMNYPGQIARIVSIDMNTGKISKICNMPTPALYYVTSLAYDSQNNRLFYSTHNSSQWRDLNVVDINTGKTEVLLKRARIGDLAFNRSDRSLWGVRHHNGYSRLVRIPSPYNRYDEVYLFRYGRDIFDIDISPDGTRLSASMIEVTGRQKLIQMDIDSLLKGDSVYDVIFEFEDNSPQNFVYSSDGNFLYGSSYYSGVSNIFRYDFNEKQMQPMTNCVTGLFRPLPFSDDSLVVFNYSSKGFTPVMIPSRPETKIRAINLLGNEVIEKYPILDSWKLDPPSPELIDIDSMVIASGRYRGINQMKLASAYPIVEGFKDFASLGMRVNLMDPLGGIDRFNLTVSYTPNIRLPKNERFHLGLDYQHWNWKFNAAYNGADFYDLFGPTKTSRKGYSLGVEYSDYLIYDKPRLLEYNIRCAGYGGLEKLPDFQNVDASFDKFFFLRARLSYSYLLKSLGAVEYEQGIKWRFIARANLVNKKLFPRFYTHLDYGFLLPIRHSSIWFRTSIGYSKGEREEPFANFYFGGFGNNWVDFQESSRYREYYSFPGIELNQIGGVNYGKGMIEWTLPPVRFRKFGIPSFYFRWARMALFSSAIITNMDDKDYRESMVSIGVQIDIRLVTFSLLKSTFSFGYALAYEKHNSCCAGISGQL